MSDTINLSARPNRPKRSPASGHAHFSCCVCNKEISRRQARLFKTCDDWKCRCQFNRDLQQHAHEQEAKFAERHQAFWDSLSRKRETLAEQDSVAESSTYLPVCVPTFDKDLVPVDEERRSELLAHLQTLATDLMGETDASEQKASTNDEQVADQRNLDQQDHLLSIACATCGGYCCQDGGNRGYIDAKTFRRYANSRRESEPDQVVAEYLDRVPDSSYQDSCIFHGSRGCVLPREMRSDLCNNFECYGLKQVRELIEERKTNRCFIAATQNETLRRYRFAEWTH